MTGIPATKEMITRSIRRTIGIEGETTRKRMNTGRKTSRMIEGEMKGSGYVQECLSCFFVTMIIIAKTSLKYYSLLEIFVFFYIFPNNFEINYSIEIKIKTGIEKKMKRKKTRRKTNRRMRTRKRKLNRRGIRRNQ